MTITDKPTTGELSVHAAVDRPFRARWLGTVGYGEAWDLQQRLFEGDHDHLLLCEHRPVYTFGVRGEEANLLVDPATVGAETYRVNRGGDITFHGPGQLVGYPVMSVAGKRGGGMADTVAYVESIEQLIIDVVAGFGLEAGRINGSPGVWLEPEGSNARKLAAIGVRLTRGRTMHGFALNVDVDPTWFGHMIPCGISDKGITSLASEGIEVSMREVVDAVIERASQILAPGRPVERAEVAWRHRPEDLAPFSRGAGPGEVVKPGRPSTPTEAAEDSTDEAPEGTKGSTGVPVRIGRRLAEAGVGEGLSISERKPSWMRVKLRTDPNYLRLKKVARTLELTTVCEEAGCPNIFDCWNEGTATFMLLGDRCTRACGFCLIDTSKPLAVDTDEPQRVAGAVRDLGIDFAVLTMVARDDLDDGGAFIVAATVEAIKEMTPNVGVEVLISDLKGSASSLATVAASAPDVLNHNIETVARLQRAVRPSASYARSLALLARGRGHGLRTKSGLIVGMGETMDEVKATLADLAAVGVDIVTIGQYLRPTSNHLPVHRWWTPAEFDELKSFGEQALGIAHVESSPLTRSSHHAGSAADAADTALS